MSIEESVRQRVEFLQALRLNGDFSKGIVDPADLFRWTQMIGQAVTELAGATVLSPVSEIKVGTALALYEVVDAYAALQKRLQELQISVPARENKDPVNTSVGEWATQQQICEQLLEPVLQQMNSVLIDLNRLIEWPTVRMIERVLQPALESAIGIIRDQEKLKQLGSELKQMGARDERYQTFNHTRDYYAEGTVQEQNADTYRASLVAQLRTQRDELDAIETFARLVAAESQIEPAYLLELTRVVADEARHSLTGELSLELLGLDPFEIPIGTIGAELRSSMDPWEGLSQICLIGETGNLQNIGQGSKDAGNLDEVAIANALHTIYCDERYHIAFGTQLLLERTPGTTAKKIQSEVLALTNRFLQERGIPAVQMSNVGSVLGE